MALEEINLVDAEGSLVAVRRNGEWICAFGGIFSAKDIRDMNALVCGEIDAISFGCPGMRVSYRSKP
jgi:hypothetical protein